MNNSSNGSDNFFQKYLKHVMELNNGKLPKSTTCSWSLRKNYKEFLHVQYFVGSDFFGAFDLSSNILRNGSNAGATFLSSMFAHSTSSPIWVDNNGLYHLRGPKDMYNFAWGTDGGNAK